MVVDSLRSCASDLPKEKSVSVDWVEAVTANMSATLMSDVTLKKEFSNNHQYWEREGGGEEEKYNWSN